MTGGGGLNGLAEHAHVLLTTFRRDGTAVSSPVWLAADHDGLAVITGAWTGKVTRLRHTTRVLLVPCDSRGRRLPGHDEIEATAELLTDRADVNRIRTMIRRRYGLRYVFASAPVRLRRGCRDPRWGSGSTADPGLRQPSRDHRRPRTPRPLERTAQSRRAAPAA